MKARISSQNTLNKGNNIKDLAKQAQAIQAKIESATEELKNKEYTANSGGGAVTVVVNGNTELKSIDIKRESIDMDDPEMLSDLIIVAVNEALRMANSDKDETISKISGNFNLPDFMRQI